MAQPLTLYYSTFHHSSALTQQRLGKDSLRDFASCFLCLHRAREPVCCPSGHLACQECIYENILHQKKNYREQTEEFKRQLNLESERESQSVRRKAEIKQAEFLRTQETLLSAGGTASRKFEKRKGTELPSFWVPNLTPKHSSNRGTLNGSVKEAITCPATEPGHALGSIKKLTRVIFHASDKTSLVSEATLSCFSCQKGFTNGTTIVVLNPCGHAFCGSCVASLQQVEDRCLLCETKAKARIKLCSEGTGYASKGGLVYVEKYDVAFRAS